VSIFFRCARVPRRPASVLLGLRCCVVDAFQSASRLSYSGAPLLVVRVNYQVRRYVLDRIWSAHPHQYLTWDSTFTPTYPVGPRSSKQQRLASQPCGIYVEYVAVYLQRHLQVSGRVTGSCRLDYGNAVLCGLPHRQHMRLDFWSEIGMKSSANVVGGIAPINRDTFSTVILAKVSIQSGRFL
jgi:hypothetical protein